MNKKQILEALFDADEMETFHDSSYDTTIEQELAMGSTMFHDEEKGSKVFRNLPPNTKGCLKLIRCGGVFNDNFITALLYQKYQEYVLGKPAIILWNDSDPEDSNGWHGVSVWVAGDSIEEVK